MLEDFLKSQINSPVLNHTSNKSNETTSFVNYVDNEKTKDFTQQFVTHFDDNTNHKKFKNSCCTCLDHNGNRKTTRDISCQWKPDVRHFTVQSSFTNVNPEVTEAAVQVDPCIFKTDKKDNSFLEDLIPKPVVIDTGLSSEIKIKERGILTTQQNLVNNEELWIGVDEKTSLSCVLAGPTDTAECVLTGPNDNNVEGGGLQLPETVSLHVASTSNNDEQEKIDPADKSEQVQKQQINEPDQKNIPPTNSNTLNDNPDKLMTQHKGLVELDYSHIPTEILQQILQQNSTSTTAAIPTVTVTENSNVEPLAEGLKPMYFIVDPVNDSYFIPTANTQQIVHTVSLISIDHFFKLFYCFLFEVNYKKFIFL